MDVATLQRARSDGQRRGGGSTPRRGHAGRAWVNLPRRNTHIEAGAQIPRARGSEAIYTASMRRHRPSPAVVIVGAVGRRVGVRERDHGVVGKRFAG
jgi:hypothetical protein